MSIPFAKKNLFFGYWPFRINMLSKYEYTVYTPQNYQNETENKELFCKKIENFKRNF